MDVEEFEGAWTLRRLAQLAAELGSATGLKPELRDRAAPLEWLAELVETLAESLGSGIFDELALLPNHEGVFQHRSDLFNDPGIDPELKGICQQLGVSLKPRLLHEAIRSERVKEVLGTLDVAEVLGQALMRAKELARQTPWSRTYLTRPERRVGSGDGLLVT